MNKLPFVFLLIITFNYLNISTGQPHSATNLIKHKPIKVGIIVVPPYIMQHKNKYTGFIIDIWKAVTKLYPLDYQFVNAGNNYEQSIIDLINNKYDILLGDYAFTKQRGEVINYSHPFFITYTSILTMKDNYEPLISKKFIFRYSFIIILLVVFFLLLSYLYYKLEIKKRTKKNLIHKYEKTRFYAISSIAAALLGGNIDKTPITITGKFLIVTSLITGIILIALFTAGITSSAILFSKDDNIFNDYHSLYQQKFLLWGGSSFEEKLLKQYQANYESIPFNQNIEEFYINNSDKYAGIVADLPINLYIKNMSHNNNFTISPLKLNRQMLGFITPYGSPYLENINQALLMLIENGTLTKICQGYFKEKTNEYCVF